MISSHSLAEARPGLSGLTTRRLIADSTLVSSFDPRPQKGVEAFSLTEAAGFALGLEENQDVVNANCEEGRISRWSDKSWRIDRVKACIPGPLTLRMMERVWSSMNSTRTWVTPPREPARRESSSVCVLDGGGVLKESEGKTSRTGPAQDAGNLDELDGSLLGIHFDD
jgi:hypothetical protein